MTSPISNGFVFITVEQHLFHGSKSSKLAYSSSKFDHLPSILHKSSPSISLVLIIVPEELRNDSGMLQPVDSQRAKMHRVSLTNSPLTVLSKGQECHLQLYCFLQATMHRNGLLTRLWKLEISFVLQITCIQHMNNGWVNRVDVVTILVTTWRIDHFLVNVLVWNSAKWNCSTSFSINGCEESLGKFAILLVCFFVCLSVASSYS